MAVDDALRDAAQHVLAMIRDHGDDLLAVTEDDELSAALEPFREEMPRLVRCGRADCNGKVVQIAINPHSPRVMGHPSGGVSDKLLAKRRQVFGHPEPPRRYVPPELREAVAAQAADLPPAPAPLYQHWSTGPRLGTDIGEPVDLHVFMNDRMRWIVTCRKAKCGARYLVTHSELLALLVMRIVQGPGDIVLPASCELSPDETVRPPLNTVD